MYCPQCATQNADDVKFCRSCGIELETVALVLSGKSVQPGEISMKSKPKTDQDWLEKHYAGVRNIITGTFLLVLSLLIGVALASFLPGGRFEELPWILVWIIFCSWMACWGSIKIGNGISGVLEAKSRLRRMGVSGKESAIDSTSQPLLSAGEPSIIANPAAFKSPQPLSVTEGTTRQLDDFVKK